MKLIGKLCSFLLAGAMAAAALTVPAAAASDGTELLKNGNAESGLSGWKDPDGIWKTMSSYDNHVTAYDGNFFAVPGFGSKDGDKTRIYQDVPVNGYEGVKLKLSAYVRTWDTNNTDETMLCLEFLNSKGNVISKTSVSSSKDPVWHKISTSGVVPENAVTARVSLYAIYHYGSEVDSYFDNVSLIAEGAAKSSTGCWTVTVKEGSSVQLGIDTNSKVKYTSSDTSVATVSSSGKVTAKSKGSAVITAVYGKNTVIIKIIVT